MRNTYVPGYFSVDTLETALPANTIEWFEASCVEGPLIVHIPQVKVDTLTPLHSLHSKIKPSPIIVSKSL